MGPVRQNPIQKTVRTAHLSVLIIVHNFSIGIRKIQTVTVLVKYHGIPFVYTDNLAERHQNKDKTIVSGSMQLRQRSSGRSRIVLREGSFSCPKKSDDPF